MTRSEPSLPAAVAIAVWMVLDAWLIYAVAQHVMWMMD